MASKENRTTENSGDPQAFIEALDHPVRRADAQILLDLFSRVTGDDPVMWGPSIIGYGRYHYKYDSGREGDSLRSGFSPRKANLSIYLTGGYANGVGSEKMDALRGKLGKHKTGASCLYITKLADVDMDVLEEMIRLDREYMDKAYPD